MEKRLPLFHSHSEVYARFSHAQVEIDTQNPPKCSRKEMFRIQKWNLMTFGMENRFCIVTATLQCIVHKDIWVVHQRARWLLLPTQNDDYLLSITWQRLFYRLLKILIMLPCPQPCKISDRPPGERKHTEEYMYCSLSLPSSLYHRVLCHALYRGGMNEKNRASQFSWNLVLWWR